MRSTLLILSVLAISAITWARPNDLKAVFVEDNEIPAVDKKILKKGVSASFGGYQASAGLGGGPNGGALFASAGIPEAGASAGIGSFGQSSAVAGAGASSSGFEYGGRPPRPIGQYGDGFFDRIFAIPINVLHSVNDYVKTKAAQGQGVYIENGSGSAGAAVSQSGVAASANAGAGAGAGVEGNTGLRFGSSSEEAAVAGSSASASSGSYAGASAAAGTGSGVGFKPGHGGHTDYDRIFNIPISALKSVNDFLNG